MNAKKRFDYGAKIPLCLKGFVFSFQNVTQMQVIWFGFSFSSVFIFFRSN